MTDLRQLGTRAADWVTEFSGSWAFIFGCIGVLVLWCAGNSTLLALGIADPYPYIFLNLVLTIVSTLQGPLILMSQNRQNDRDRESVGQLTAKLDELLARGERGSP